MTDTLRVESKRFSRRTVLLHTAGCTAGAAAALVPLRQAAAKMAQAAASYQDSPKGDQQCDNCTLFRAPNSCQLVDGTISPSGWCKFWVKKTG